MRSGRQARRHRRGRAYRTDLARLPGLVRAPGPAELPASADTVADHLGWCATVGGLSPSSIGRRTAAIRYAHKLAGLEPPTTSETVRAAVAGIRRTFGAAPKCRKSPVTAERLTGMLMGLPDTLAGKRDRAVLALGFAGAFRRAELVALTVADLTEVPDGLRVLIRRSKTDQTGEGQEIAIPRGYRLRPVEAVQAWLDAAGITEGPIFRPITTRRLDGRGKPVTQRIVARRRCHDDQGTPYRGHRETMLPGCGPRSGGVQRPFVAVWVCDQRGRDKRANHENRRANAASIVGYAAGLQPTAWDPRSENILARGS